MRAAEADHRNIDDNEDPEEDQETEIYEESEEDPEELIEEDSEEEEEEGEDEEEIEEEIYEESDQNPENVTSKEHDQENDIDGEPQEEGEEEEIEEEIYEESDQDPENQEIEIDEDPEEDPEKVVCEPEEDPEEEIEEKGKGKKVVEESATILVTELGSDRFEKKRRKSRWDQSQEPETPQIDGTSTIKRKTRWDNDDSSKNRLVQLPSFIDLMQKSSDPTIFTLQLRLMEIDKKLQNFSTEISKRGRKRLLKEGRRIISELTPALNAPVKYVKKVFVPTKEYPNYNFFGLIIGPRGHTQKKMQKETGAKILLRGAGSGSPDSNDEDLHILVEADSQKSLDHAVALIEKLLIPVSDQINDHKKAQLTELAKLKGTYIDHGTCSLCKEKRHKQIVCPLNESTFKTVGCDFCGGFSHLTSNCKKKPRKEVNNANIYVGYLSPAIDDKRLKELFLPFGKINETAVIKDQKTGFSKGYGFVMFDDPLDAADAIKYMNGYKMDGKMLAVNVAGPKAAPNPILQAPIPFPVYIPGRAPIIPQIQVNGNLGFSNSSGYSGQIGENFHVARTGPLNLPPPYVVPSMTDPRMGSDYSSGYDLSGNMNSLLPKSVSQFPGDPDYPGSQFKSYFQ